MSVGRPYRVGWNPLDARGVLGSVSMIELGSSSKCRARNRRYRKGVEELPS